MFKRTLAVLTGVLFCCIVMAAHLQAAEMRISWNAPTTNANGTPLTDLAGYTVHHGLSSRNYTVSVNVGNMTSYLLTGLTSGRLYYAAVTAYDTSGNRSSYSNEVSFTPQDTAPSPSAPVASFTTSTTSGTAPLSVNFTDTSTGSITSWAWTFGDGGTSTTRNPQYTYQNVGTYTARLTVSSASGSTSASRTITVLQSPGSTSGLVAAYSFGESSGSTVFDVSGHGNHGTISGAQRTSSGRFGRALVFDGVNDWVTIPDAASLDLTTGMTLEAWVYPTTTPTGWRPLLIKEQPGNAVYYLYANSEENRPATGVYVDSERILYGGSRLPVNTWTHLAATYDGSRQRLYVNGTQVASRAQSGSMPASTGVLRIGGDNVWRNFFTGRIDEVRMYNRALTASQIQVDMSTPISSTTSGGSLSWNTHLPRTVSEFLPSLGKSMAPAGGRTPPASNSASSSSSSSATGFVSETATSSLLTLAHIETGEVLVDHQWKRVEVGKYFADPVVVAKALSYHDASPAVVRIRHVDPRGFELRLQSWHDSDGVPVPETTGYLVFERGRYTLADGITVEADSVEVSRQHALVSLSFSRPFQVTPVVMTAVSSPQGDAALIGRPSRISRQGFQFRRHSWATDVPPGEGTETISYIAWEPSSGTIEGTAFEVGKTLEVKRDQFSTLAFSEVFSGAPIFLAEIQATRGGNPLNVRWDHKDLAGINVKIDEVPSADGEIPTPIDVIGFILLK